MYEIVLSLSEDLHRRLCRALGLACAKPAAAVEARIEAHVLRLLRAAARRPEILTMLIGAGKAGPSARAVPACARRSGRTRGKRRG
jgi:hypothetical protein